MPLTRYFWFVAFTIGLARMAQAGEDVCASDAYVPNIQFDVIIEKMTDAYSAEVRGRVTAGSRKGCTITSLAGDGGALPASCKKGSRATGSGAYQSLDRYKYGGGAHTVATDNVTCR